MKKYYIASILVLAFLSLNYKSYAQGKSYLISPNNFEKYLKKDPKAVLIDLRTDEEVDQGIIEGALQFNFYDEGFEQSIALLKKDKNYYVYCKAGGRSGKATAKMVEMGFIVYDLKGGITAWKEKNKPTVEMEETF